MHIHVHLIALVTITTNLILPFDALLHALIALPCQDISELFRNVLQMQ